MEILKKNYNGLDIGKFLCAFLILFYHYFTEHRGLPSLIEEALSLYAVAVALFMLISGFLTFDKIKNVEDRTERWNVVKKQFLRIFKVYLLWSIVYVIYNISRWNFADISLSFVLWQIQGWVFGSTFYTIWFMPALAIGLIVAFWLTEKLPSWLCTLLGIVLYALGSLMSTYYFVGDMIPGFQTVADFIGTWLGGARGWLLFATPLLMLGKFAVKVKDKIKVVNAFILAVLFLGAILAEALLLRKFVGHTGIDLALMMVPCVFFILMFLLNIKIPDGDYAVWMRKMSVLLFMTQRIFLTVIPSLLSIELNDKLFANTYIGSLFVCGGTVLFSVLIIAFSNKIKWLKNLY